MVDDSADAPLRITAAMAAVLPAQPSLLVVSWTQDAAAEVHVAYSFDADVWMESPPRSLAAGPHEELLVGIPYGMSTTWRLVDAEGAALSVDTSTANGDPPEGLPLPEVLIEDPSRWDGGGAPYLFTTLATEGFGDPWWRVIYDRRGRAVWARPSDPDRCSLHARVAGDGRSLYLDQNSFWSMFDAGAASTVEQTLLDGSIVRTFATPGLHHPFTDLPDGSVAYGAVTGMFADEALTEVDPDGAVTVRWACQAFLERLGVVDRCGSNALTYDSGTDHFLYSFYSFETVVDLDRSTGEETRWFGRAPGSYAFGLDASRSWWQHGAIVTGTGTLLLSSDVADEGVETVVREYAIDAETETLNEVWNFGVGDGVYGQQMGEATRLPNGNTWHNYGRDPRLREATPDGAVVWDLQWEGTAIGRSMPLVDLYALLPERR